MIPFRLKQFRFITIALALLLSCFCGAESAVEKYGALRVEGAKIVGKSGVRASLAGPSLFWSNTGWGGERFYNADVVDYVVKQWRATIIRAAIGVAGNGGYLAKPEANLAKAERVIEAAIAQGIYVIVDWHSHNAEKTPTEAIEFFQTIAKKYGDKPNVIYEIYNEPLRHTDWSTQIKPYAVAVIEKIRAIDPDNMIIVGTQTWSQDVDKAAADPLVDVTNVAYALHFFAGSHKQWLRDKARAAINKGLPIVVSEWGTVSDEGTGAVDLAETQLWMAFLREHQLIHCNWALNDKRESASQLKPGTWSDGKWSDEHLSESGLVVKNIIYNWGK